MQVQIAISLVSCALLCACASPSAPMSIAGIKQEVVVTERAFAKTMADRNLEAFAAFIAEEAIFFSGSSPLRGRQAVVDGWARYFTAPTAPFSWEPEEVEFLATGRLAFSSGPVKNPQGKIVARFNSIWRLEDSGQWRIVFDKGSDVCNCASP